MPNKIKKYTITFTPKGTRARFVHRQFDSKSEASIKVKEILKRDNRTLINPRVKKNPFFKK